MPPPRTRGSLRLEQAIASRRSVREFGDEPLTDRQLSQLLWATHGITGDDGLRAAPSAGGLYPLELYVALPDGLFHYVPERHALAEVATRDLRPALWRASLRQGAIRRAPAVFAISAVPARTAAEYGTDRGRCYIDMEVGHAAQNLLLQAVALGLGGVPIGAFHDDRIRETLGLAEGEEPRYLIPVGRPR